jgi:hypothetical protein
MAVLLPASLTAVSLSVVVSWDFLPAPIVIVSLSLYATGEAAPSVPPSPVSDIFYPVSTSP